MQKKLVLVVCFLLPCLLYANIILASPVERLEKEIDELSEKIRIREEALRDEYAFYYGDEISGRVYVIASRQSCYGDNLDYATNHLGLPFLENVPKLDGRIATNYSFFLQDIMDLNYSHSNPNGFTTTISVRSIAKPLTKEYLQLNLQALNFKIGQFQVIGGSFKADFTPLTIWGKKNPFNGSVANSFDATAQMKGWESGAFPFYGFKMHYNSNEGSITGFYSRHEGTDVFAFRSVFSIGRVGAGDFNVVRILADPPDTETVYGGRASFVLGRNKIQLELQHSQLNKGQPRPSLTPLEDMAWLCSASSTFLGFEHNLAVGATGSNYWSALGERDFSIGYNLSRTKYANPFADADSPSGPDFDYFRPGLAEPGREHYRYSIERKIGSLILGFQTVNFKRSKISQEELLSGAWDAWVDNQLYCKLQLNEKTKLPLSLTYRFTNNQYRMVNMTDGAPTKSEHFKTKNEIRIDYQAAGGSVFESELIFAAYPSTKGFQRIISISSLQYPLGSNAFAKVEYSLTNAKGTDGHNYVGREMQLILSYSF